MPYIPIVAHKVCGVTTELLIVTIKRTYDAMHT